MEASKIVCAPADMEDDPILATLPDGKPDTLTPWIIGMVVDSGIVRLKHRNLVECINTYNKEARI